MKKPVYLWIIVLLIVFICISIVSLLVRPVQKNNNTKPQNLAESNFTVDKVVDGDTIHVLYGTSTIYKIRILGINTPETVDPRKPVECFGKEASLHMKEILPRGTYVHLIADSSQNEIDKYGRLLRYVEIGTSTDIGLSMIRDGYAYQYLFKNSYQRYGRYVRAEKQARDEKKGLWGSLCNGKK